jgi:diguanylate cyclase (GGDEF)-like protein
LVPLLAAVAYVPLLVGLLMNRPWGRQQWLFLLFLIPAFSWSVVDIFFRSDFLMQEKLLLVRLGICIAVWMGVQYHYLLCSFYRSQRIRVPLAYVLLVGIVVMAALGVFPQGMEVTAEGINIYYGLPILSIVGSLFALGGRDVYLLIRRRSVLVDPVERNQIAYLFVGVVLLIAFTSISFVPSGGEYPVGHIGNLLNAAFLTYAVVAHRLLDVRVVLRSLLMYVGMYGVGVAGMIALLSLAHRTLGLPLHVPTMLGVILIGVPLTFFFFHRVREPWRERVEQSLGGERYGYRRQLSDFVARIHNVPTLEQFGNRLLSLLSQSVGARRACLLLPEGEASDFAVRFTYPANGANPMANVRLRRDSPVLAWLEREARTLPKRFLETHAEFQGLWEQERSDLRVSGVEILLPLINRRELVAVLAVAERRDHKLYTVEDIHLMEEIAGRVAASMEKEYLHAQLEEQERELSLANRLTGIITSSLNIQEIFHAFARELEQVVELDYAMIILIEEDELNVYAISDPEIAARWVGRRIPLAGSATEWVARNLKSLYEPDLQKNSRFDTGEYFKAEGVRSKVTLPLVVRGEVIGTLNVGAPRPNLYSEKDIRLLESLALQIATPIENAHLYDKAEQRGRVDELTGLFNRRHFEERLKEEIGRHARYAGEFSVLMLDLDSFKAYNDMYGHPSGDELLRRMAALVRGSVRDSDQAFRYGGDEIVVILPETSVDDARGVAERIRENIAAEMETRQLGVTCSIGLASYPSDGVMSGELLDTADTALYYAKNTGGNRVYVSSSIFADPAPAVVNDGRKSGLSAVYALSAAVDARDHYTYGHSRRVNTYAVALAEAIGLSPDEVSRVSTAALLHDIGKIGVPDKILNKKGKLDDEEWKAIKSHPRLGANIVGNVPSLASCMSGILYHHERWDGTGYPEGLRGEVIPLASRILAVADAFAAMTSPRPYREALEEDQVLAQLRREAGKQFDPTLVEAFIGLIEAGLPSRPDADRAAYGRQPPA